jgi:hypothetical protein
VHPRASRASNVTAIASIKGEKGFEGRMEKGVEMLYVLIEGKESYRSKQATTV